MPWGDEQCDKVRDFDEATTKEIQANDIVFSIHIPPVDKEMSPWFQFILVVLQIDVAYKKDNVPGESAKFNPTKQNDPEGGGGLVWMLIIKKDFKTDLRSNIHVLIFHLMIIQQLSKKRSWSQCLSALLDRRLLKK